MDQLGMPADPFTVRLADSDPAQQPMNWTMTYSLLVMFALMMFFGAGVQYFFNKQGWGSDQSHVKIFTLLVLLVYAYAGKYFCSSCQYVVQNLWRSDQGVSSIALSYMFVGGYVASMCGKVVAGYLSDTWGGKKVLMMSTYGFITSAFLFAFVPQICTFLHIPFEYHYYVFYAVWVNNGFWGLGLGWVAIMAVATNWVPDAYMGRYMAFVGCAPEFGDAFARAFLAGFIDSTGSWSVTWVAAGLASILICLPMFLFVDEGPQDREEKVQGEKKPKKQKPPYFATLKKLFLGTRLMTLVCVLCGLLYGVRTMFLLYAVSYLNTVYCQCPQGQICSEASFKACLVNQHSVAAVASASILYTVFGCVSVLLSGYLKDRMPKRQRGSVLTANLVILTLALGTMYFEGTDIPFWVATLLVGMCGFAIFGPYKTMSGAFAVDIGGKDLKASASGFMGVASNFSAAVMLIVKGYIGGNWDDMFLVLLALSVVGTVCAVMIWQFDLANIKPTEEPGAKYTSLPESGLSEAEEQKALLPPDSETGTVEYGRTIPRRTSSVNP